MSTLVRGQPEGDTYAERLQSWLGQPPVAGEAMIWVGKNYSLAQIRADVRALFDDVKLA